MITGHVNDGRIPPSLLFAHDFRKNGYDVYVTDLVHMWAESLDRRAINKRALITDTSIDPTEDDEQMKLLLDKVKQGLEQGHGSELTMTIRSNGNDYGVDRLPICMKVTVDLPKPFKPLEWTLELEPCDQSKFTNELVIPLIEAQDEARNEVSSLMAVIRQKDHVIQKLVDKLEASGTELGQVFPSATAKGGGKLTRKVVEERVAGLAPFNHQTWQEDFNHAEAQKGKDDFEQFDELMGRCFVDPGLNLPSGHRGIEGAQTTWWREIKGETITICESCHWDGSPVALSNAARGKGQQATTKNPEANLQVPTTPPPARHQPQISPTRNLHNRHVVDDDETDEDLDSASQSQPAKVPDSFRSPEKPASKPPIKKLGGIGGEKSSKAKSKTPPPAQPSRSSQSQTIVDDDDTTEGEDDGFEEAQPKKKSSPEEEKPSGHKRAASPTPERMEASPKKTPKKGGLGKIGGKKKLSPPPVTEQGGAQAGGSQMLSRTKPKLGHVGGKKDGDEEDGRGRPVEKEEERPRETSAEARQRRKREMEERLEKEAARPKKKKRIF